MQIPAVTHDRLPCSTISPLSQTENLGETAALKAQIEILQRELSSLRSQ